MLLRSLSLRNIRSYQDATVSFPEGRILLSGDVGSGKTSILLAVEFALFGILRGELSAASLLRHGEKEGRVQLSFSVDGASHEVVRTLRRDGKGVKQGPGSFDGESLTPVELKARVLAAIGYSQDLLTRAKSLVFRYTVYTPQEEMKHILFEDPDARLETLRKVFGIDQYKAAQHNASLVLRELRSEEKARLVQLEDLPHKVREREEASARLSSIRERKSSLAARRQERERSLAAAQEEHDRLRVLAEHYHEARRRLSVLEAEKARVLKRREELRAQLSEEKPARPAVDVEDVRASIQKREDQLVLVEERLSKAAQRQASLRAGRSQAQRARERLLGLGSQCPLCEQQVPHEHKDRLVEEQASALSKAEARLAELSSFLQQAEEKRSSLKEQVSSLQRSLLAASQAAEREKARQEALRRSREELSRLEEEFSSLSSREAEAREAAKASEAHVESLRRQESSLSKEREALSELKVEEARSEATLASTQQQLDSLEAAIARLQRHQDRVRSLQAGCHWLKECFVPLTDRVERAVFGSVHEEFSSLFSGWFDQIIEDDLLRVRLDGGFSPVVELNGYETEVQALSGGERTAVALAYRLALNQVISEFVGSIATRGLLILDEPTDGFSSFQLTRMRDVLDQLRSEQVVIVSHEQQVEGFVEHVIRVRKESQVSVIEQ